MNVLIVYHQHQFDGFVEETIPGYLDLIKEGQQITDTERRKEIYLELQQLWAEELPGYFLYPNPRIYVMRDHVEGFETDVSRQPEMKFVWLDK